MILQEREKELEEHEKMLSQREEAFKAQVSNVDIEHYPSRVQQRPPTPHSEMSSTNIVTPQTRGFVDYSSTRGIQVDVGLPDATSENSGRVSFVRGALPK